jgi:hypothetical protein
MTCGVDGTSSSLGEPGRTELGDPGAGLAGVGPYSFLAAGVTASGLYPGFRVPDGVGAVQQWLAAQALADVAGFLDGSGSSLGIVLAHEIPGMVEQAVCEVVGPA